jgi:hypothetical protein
MAALTKDRMTPSKELGTRQSYPVRAGAKIYLGALVSIDANGYARPAGDVASEICVGISAGQAGGDEASTVDNTGGADGAKFVNVDQGVFDFATSGGSALVQADVGRSCEVLDDQTVVKAAGVANHVKAGEVREILSATSVRVAIFSGK